MREPTDCLMLLSTVMKIVVLPILIFGLLCQVLCAQERVFNLAAFDRARVLQAANRYLKEEPITITASTSPRSAGGLHDFFSEGDYWWPDPQNPDAPYIQHDGLTNTNNFVDHRHAMVRLSEIVATMTSAYILTGDEKYA